ncbi:MAG: hypothetical protein HDR25_07880 [Lachnospiraceae bacterium]|nr:hypothetical protein [Lachnospiraceae bacterium]
MMGRDPEWERFAELTARCYKAAENGNTLNACWNDAFDVLMEIVAIKRGEDSSFARELGDMEKLTDFKFNIEGLILDYLDKLWEAGDYEKLCISGNRIISMFDWRVESSSVIRIKVVNALVKIGKKDEAVQYCIEWIKAEPEDVNAVMTKKALLTNAGTLKKTELTEGEAVC